MADRYLSGTYAAGYTRSGVYPSVTLGARGSIGGTGLVGGTAATSYSILNHGRIAASATLASGISAAATTGSSSRRPARRRS
jgi:hypothetical protein